VKVLLFTDRFSKFTGGNKRTIEVMKRAESHGIDYVSVIDKRNLLQFQSMRIGLPNFRYSMQFGRRELRSELLFPQRAIKSSEQLAQLAKSEGVDLIFSPHEFLGVEMIARMASALTGIPWTVLMMAVPVVIGTRPTHSITESAKLRLFLLAARDTTLLSVSSIISDYLTQLQPSVKIECLMPGVGVDTVGIRSLKPANEHYDAIYYAHLVPEKGVEEALQAWRKVVDSKPDAKLAVSGWGSVEELRGFKERIVHEDLQRNVSYLGFVHGDDLMQLIKSCTATIYPSHLDSIPLAVIESLACGTPVVTYSIPGIRANYSDCSAVLQVPEGDTDSIARHLVELIDDQALRRNLSQSAAHFSERFDWEEVVEAEKRAYTRTIEDYSG
jgi:glycosyltransferase involved in cell wall biosynthesis